MELITKSVRLESKYDGSSTFKAVIDVETGKFLRMNNSNAITSTIFAVKKWSDIVSITLDSYSPKTYSTLDIYAQIERGVYQSTGSYLGDGGVKKSISVGGSRPVPFDLLDYINSEKANTNGSNLKYIQISPTTSGIHGIYNLTVKYKTNDNPTITATTTPSGTYATKPSFNYTVADGDNHTMTITEKIDGIVFNTRTNVASATTLTYTPSDLAWLRTRINQMVNIEITADDGNGGVTTVTYPITRTTPEIDLQLKTPFVTDVAARRLLLQLEGNIPNDAIVSVQACNNAFDASPTWENATNLVLSGFPYPFNNKVKIATKWGVSFKIRIERGGSTQPIYIDGLGGAFD